MTEEEMGSCMSRQVARLSGGQWENGAELNLRGLL